MKRTEPTSIADVLRMTLQQNRLDRQMRELQALRIWKAMVGPHIASQCHDISVAKGVISIGVANAALRHELSLSRSRMMQHINAAVNAANPQEYADDVISDIRFTG